jgi:hypothetical protein
MNTSKIISSSIIAIALIFIGTKLSSAWQTTHVSYNNIGVTGLGTQNFDSDLMVWNATFSRNAETLAEANALIKNDIDDVKSFLKKNGIPENEMSFTSLKINKNYKQLYNNEGNPSGTIFEGYNLLQEVTIESKNINAVEKSIREIGDLIEKGIEFTANEPDYYYTKLADLKLELLKKATQDALKRAQTVAENANSSIGNLKGAEMGVFQITGQNTNEDYSWGGSFNTKAKHKTASITVKLSFEL